MVICCCWMLPNITYGFGNIIYLFIGLVGIGIWYELFLICHIKIPFLHLVLFILGVISWHVPTTLTILHHLVKDDQDTMLHYFLIFDLCMQEHTPTILFAKNIMSTPTIPSTFFFWSQSVFHEYFLGPICHLISTSPNNFVVLPLDKYDIIVNIISNHLGSSRLVVGDIHFLFIPSFSICMARYTTKNFMLITKIDSKPWCHVIVAHGQWMHPIIVIGYICLHYRIDNSFLWSVHVFDYISDPNVGIMESLIDVDIDSIQHES